MDDETYAHWHALTAELLSKGIATVDLQQKITKVELQMERENGTHDKMLADAAKLYPRLAWIFETDYAKDALMADGTFGRDNRNALQWGISHHNPYHEPNLAVTFGRPWIFSEQVIRGGAMVFLGKNGRRVGDSIWFPLSKDIAAECLLMNGRKLRGA